MKGGFIMIRCNLSIILAENNIKITKVAHDTGISRTTLTALSQNNCKGIQFDTLDKLCRYLNVTPTQLIDYTPIELYGIDFSTYEETIKAEEYGFLTFHLKKGVSEEYYCTFSASLKPTGLIFTKEKVVSYELTIHQAKDEETLKALNVLNQLSRPFFIDVSNKILQDSIVGKFNLSEHFELTVNWKVNEIEQKLPD